jgi:hypothetical protein
VESIWVISPGRNANVGVNARAGRLASDRRVVAVPNECRPVANWLTSS